MNSEEPQGPEDVVSELYFEFVETLRAGKQPDLEQVLEGREELSESIEEAHRMALGLVGMRGTTRPMLRDYEIVRELGRGSMGQVYLARQVNLDRLVALKVLPQGVALSPRGRQRFLDEARALAKLNHDHVIAVHDVIQEDDVLAYAMDWVEGMSFRSALRLLQEDLPAPDPVEAATLAAMRGAPNGSSGRRSLLRYFVKLGVTIGGALHMVHEAGLVHRDVKPANILIRRDGTALLADFGLARGVDSDLTITGAFVGTPVYAPIEQLQPEVHGDVDRRADVYALCVTLYEAVSGATPFKANSTSAVLSRIEAGVVPRLRKAAPHAPRDLETILAKGMERDRNDRYATAAELADDLLRLLQLEPIHARPASPLRRLRGVLRRQRRSMVGGVLGAVLVACVLLPILIAPDASAVAARSRELVEHARVQLLSSERWHRVWRVSSLGQPSAGSAVDELRAASDSYRQALDLMPDSPEAQLEHATVDAVIALIEGGDPKMPDPASAARLARLPVGSQEFLRHLRRCATSEGGGSSSTVSLDLSGSSDRERMNIGLIAFLIGDYSLCESAWLQLDPLRPEYAFCNAALGILYHVDGRPQRAYPRLFQALTSYPEADFLLVDLAELAAEMGDVELGEHWLKRSRRRKTYRYGFVSARLAFASGRLDEASQIVNNLQTLAPDIPAAPHLRARIALDVGETEQAWTMLRKLVRRWSMVAAYRLDLARLSLQLDRPGVYLEQVRYVLRKNFGKGRSPGNVRDLLEILRIGGLSRLHREGVKVTGCRLARSDDVGEVPGRLGDQRLRGQVEALMEHIRRFDLEAVSFELPSASAAESQLAGMLSAASRGSLHAPPGIRSVVGWRNSVGLVGAALVLRAKWSTVTGYVLPALSKPFASQRGAAPQAHGWTERRVSGMPPPHTDHVLVGTHEGVVLFGGATGRGALRGGTWRWDGSVWTQLLGSGPAARMRHAAAYDKLRRRLVLFGGSTSSVVGFMRDTWEFDGRMWNKLDVSARPSARNDHTMTYDPDMAGIVLFGGRDAGRLHNDCWVFDGSRWKEVATGEGPGPRREHCAGWDPTRGGVVVFGGFGESNEILGDTWILRRGKWNRVMGPETALAGSAVAHGIVDDRLIRFSGYRGPTPGFTWELGAEGWAIRTEARWPVGRSGHAMTYDFVRERIVMFGGWSTSPLADLWEYR